ncbi:hypothetical protein [Bacillus sp. Marseille-P3661]|uniref:hypothetical protein n=1 Tax=Bacillus sp. Marseille-P3661 TaxID=1936234 RepID=UPI000C833DE8|nr:hypothetical protein [Bacillus sp. Marseille-P3661]
MQYKALIILFLIITFQVTASTTSAIQQIGTSQIMDIKTSPAPNINQWVTLPHRKTGSLLVEVFTVGSEARKVNFWKVPVKDKSWKKAWEHRELLSEDTEGRDGWSTTITYGNKSIFTFIVVEVIDENDESDMDWFYLLYKK